MTTGIITNAMRPVHPGEILREEFFEPLQVSANALSIRLRVPAPRVTRDEDYRTSAVNV